MLGESRVGDFQTKINARLSVFPGEYNIAVGLVSFKSVSGSSVSRLNIYLLHFSKI